MIVGSKRISVQICMANGFTKLYEFNGKYRRDLQTDNWHYYETDSGYLYHFRKDWMVTVKEGPKMRFQEDKEIIEDAINLNALADSIHENAKKKGFYECYPNILEKLCLIHAEVSEAVEEYRKQDVVLSDFGEELADIIIRTLDLAAYFEINIQDAIVKKHSDNIKRPYKHGKRF